MKKDHSSYTMILLKFAMLTGNLHRSLSYYFISPIIVHFHELSHSCATLLLENGATMQQVEEWLGHHSYVVTADTYGHVLAESKKAMADTMSGLLKDTNLA